MMLLFSRNSFLTSFARWVGGPVHYRHYLSKMPLHRLEILDKGRRVEPIVCPKELPAVLGDGAVHRDLLVAPRVRHGYPLSSWRPILASGHRVVYEKRLIPHDRNKSVLFQAWNLLFEAILLVLDGLFACPVDVDPLRLLG